MLKFKNLCLLISLTLMVSGCGLLSIGGTITEKSIRTGEKLDNIVYIGTRSCLECIFSDWGWNSAGHPGPGCVIDLPFSLAFDTAFLPYTIPKTIINLSTSKDSKSRQLTDNASSEMDLKEAMPPTQATNDKPVDVWLLPIEGFPPEYARELEKVFSAELGLRVRATVHTGRTPTMYSPSGQMLAERVRDNLKVPIQRLYNVTPKTIFIALTPDDLNSEDGGTRFVFAMHFPPEHLSVFSTARLNDAFYGKPGNPGKMGFRLYKMVKKAIGLQYYGYRRSTDLKSVMYSPIMSLNDLDAVGTSF